MQKPLLMVALAFFIMIMSIAAIWLYTNQMDYLEKTVHETNKWVVISDSRGDIIAVETNDQQIWNTLVDLNKNKTTMWIGGIVQLYGNKWGFRFNPNTIIIAEITIEGAQSNIIGISNDIDYWINTWEKETYVLAQVIELHG